MSLTLVERLKRLYPDADFRRDIVVQDDGEGPYIAQWNSDVLGPRPTKKQLSDADALPEPVDPDEQARIIVKAFRQKPRAARTEQDVDEFLEAVAKLI